MDRFPFTLNIIDPDGAWDSEETLEIGDFARVYLREYPITNWEIEGALRSSRSSSAIGRWVSLRARTAEPTQVLPSSRAFSCRSI